jgi:hypothetical protein
MAVGTIDRGNALTSLRDLSETNARKELQTKEITVRGKWNAREAWQAAIALSAYPRPVRDDIRSGCDEAFYHQLGIELSPSAGGPPG